MAHPYRYVSVMGTMGSGKTTAARLIAQKLGYQLIEENFGENAFLPRFYRRMNRWAFHSQTFFLMEKITQLIGIQSVLEEEHVSGKHAGIIQDTPIQQDVFSYARAQHTLANMDDAEWRLYQKIYRSFEAYLPKPDLIVRLRASIPVVRKRISNRGRGFEKRVPVSYLTVLDDFNSEWVEKEHHLKYLDIPVDDLNIVQSKADQHAFIEIIRHALDQME